MTTQPDALIVFYFNSNIAMATKSMGSPSTGDDTIAQNCPLLALPGELRNRIYELAVEDATSWQAKDFAEVSDDEERSKRLRDFHVLMTPHVRKDGSAEIPWAALKRKYLGLTQTCRQLRAESSGVFSRIWTRVNLADLQKYVDQVILAKAKDNASAVGCIEIVAPKPKSNAWIDTRDFLLLYGEAPQLQIRFAPCHEPGSPLIHIESSNLGPVLQSKSSLSGLYGFVRDKAVAVLPVVLTTVSCGVKHDWHLSSEVVGLYISVKDEFLHDWMTNGNATFCGPLLDGSRTWYQEPEWQAWLEGAGLPPGTFIKPSPKIPSPQVDEYFGLETFLYTTEPRDT